MNTDRRDKELQGRAKALVEGISPLRGGDQLPLVVEFAGSPKAGKTTNIDIVYPFLQADGFQGLGTHGGSKQTHAVFSTP